MERGYLQQFAELSEFDSDARREQAIAQKKKELGLEYGSADQYLPQNPLEQRVFDMSNPNADWAGEVPRQQGRKKLQGGAHAVNIRSTEHGIMPAPNLDQKEIDDVGSRKHYEDDLRFRHTKDGRLSNAQQCSPGYHHTQNEWQTQYQAQCVGKKTDKSQFETSSLHHHVQKRMIIPTHDRSRQSRQLAAYERPTAGGRLPTSTIAPSTRSPLSVSSKSMLAGIGSKLTESNALPAATHQSAMQQYQRGVKKDGCYLENYHANKLGYSGHRPGRI